MKTAKALILTDDGEFARLIGSCWRTEKKPPKVVVLSPQEWQAQDTSEYDLTIIGPVGPSGLSSIVPRLCPEQAAILCAPLSLREIQQLRSRHPRLLHIPLREDWAQTLLLVAGESLRRVEANQLARQALNRAAQSERDATLGRYMLEMKHNVNNALTSILGNAELLLLEPGQLSAQSLQQIKTVHQMSLRLNEIMQRFSSLASEMREVETLSQAETDDVPVCIPPQA